MLGQYIDAPDKDRLLALYSTAQAGTLADKNALRQYLANTWVPLVDQASPPYVMVGGDTLGDSPLDYMHPSPPGSLMMAALLLKQMGADGLVSAVTLDAAQQAIVEVAKAHISGLRFAGAEIDFDRLDDALPFPIPLEARSALTIKMSTALGDPSALFGMSRYYLAILHLPAGTYTLSIDSTPVTNATAEELSSGIDLGLLSTGPLADQGLQILAAVAANEASTPTAAGDAQIRAAARPQSHHFTIAPFVPEDM